ncbi:hypothetical protein [Kitasatospora sp. NPDC050543]|uniref:hypothetical protein n=1 Tax=Kitasatospora sp. NPDC050543 TaxID=3364054 RepID=UPI00378A5238
MSYLVGMRRWLVLGAEHRDTEDVADTSAEAVPTTTDPLTGEHEPLTFDELSDQYYDESILIAGE